MHTTTRIFPFARVSLVIALAFAACPSAGESFGEIDAASFVGWTHGSRYAAVERMFGLFGDGPEGRWNASYIVLHDLTSGRRSLFRLEATTTAAVGFIEDWKNYSDGRPRKEWEVFKQNRPLVKSLPTPTSPGGKWRIELSISGRGARVSTRMPTSDDLGEEPKGNPVAYAVKFDSPTPRGVWELSAHAVSSVSRILVHQEEFALLENGGIRGSFDGVYSAFWPPDGKAIALQWINFAPVGGGSWSKVIVKDLPKQNGF